MVLWMNWIIQSMQPIHSKVPGSIFAEMMHYVTVVPRGKKTHDLDYMHKCIY